MITEIAKSNYGNSRLTQCPALYYIYCHTQAEKPPGYGATATVL